MIKNIHFDGEIALATALKRDARTWKNKDILFSEFVNKVSQTTRTHETVNEYRGLVKSSQDEIKDVGGYVAAYLDKGRRLKNSVVCRSMLTLDLDFSPGNFWELFTKRVPYAAVLYSTHKHTAKNPRFRLCVPLEREVRAEEYEAIARKLADAFDLDWFDDTTFQPSRFMFWPSTSKDGDYIFEYQDAEWLDPDFYLGLYRDWTDVSAWPFSSRQDAKEARLVKEQEDPRDKDNMVGSFCRTHTISAAIDIYLSEQYSYKSEDRYTFTGGSTSGGLVVYDDLFAYSHHGTDPASGELCNAFDLVRMHLFADKDEKVKYLPIEKKPSYLAMVQLAGSDGDVRKTIGREKVESALEDFGEFSEEEVEKALEEDDSWLESLEYDKKGNIQQTIDNILVILRNDPILRGAFAFNELERAPFICSRVPWRGKSGYPSRREDLDLSGLRHYLEKAHGITSISKTEDALNLVCNERKYNPVVDYLNELPEWDGERRAEYLFMDFFDAEDTEYHRAVTIKTLIGAVSRAYEPGSIMQYMLVLQGPQGIKKSRIWKKLAGDWFTDSFDSFEGKEAVEQIMGKWIVEMPELSSFKKATTVEKVKHFLTILVDRFRPAYGRHTIEAPRSCIFVGTVNDDNFLKDKTGNRRFWPVKCPIDRFHWKVTENWMDKYLTEDYVAQVWAEAKARYVAGELPKLDAHLELEALRTQDSFTEVDEMTGHLKRLLETPLPPDFDQWKIDQKREYYRSTPEPGEDYVEREHACVLEIWEVMLGQDVSRWSKKISRDINNAIIQIEGWSKKKKTVRTKVYGPQKVVSRDK